MWMPVISLNSSPASRGELPLPAEKGEMSRDYEMRGWMMPVLLEIKSIGDCSKIRLRPAKITPEGSRSPRWGTRRGSALVCKDDRKRESADQNEADRPGRIQIEPASRHELEAQVAVDQPR